jgi:hypothetical protein
MAEPRLARPEVWCDSFCWKHAREKGLKPPPSTAGKNKKPQKKCKKWAQQANAKKDPDLIEEEDEGTEFEEKAEKNTKGKKATSIKNEVKKKTKKRTGRASENAAKEDLGEEGEAGCSIPNRSKRFPRFGCPLLNTQTHPPLELPEHEKDTEMQSDQAGGTFENEQEPMDAPKATRDN